MAKGMYERRAKCEVTYYIRYQGGFTRELAKEVLKSRLGDMARGHFNLEKTRRPVPFSNFAERYREFASGYKREWYEENTSSKSLQHCSAILPWRRSLLGRSRSGNQTKQKRSSRRQSTDAFTVMKPCSKKLLIGD